jgi:hypothetical protein
MRDFYVIRDDRGRWGISSDPSNADSGVTYRSHIQALDVLRDQLSKGGLVMGRSVPEGTNFRVEALEPSKAPDNRPMLYSAEAMKAMEEIRERLGRTLKQHALDLAKRDGRKLVTEDDIWSALENLDIAEVYAGSDEEADNER